MCMSSNESVDENNGNEQVNRINSQISTEYKKYFEIYQKAMKGYFKARQAQDLDMEAKGEFDEAKFQIVAASMSMMDKEGQENAGNK